MTTVRDVMTTPVVTVTEWTPLKEVARKLVDHRISGLPVVGDGGRLVGVISEADLLTKESGPDGIPHRRFERLFGESSGTRTARAKVGAVVAGQAMTSPAVTISLNEAIRMAAQVMVDHRINRLPVVDGDALVGIVTRADLVRAYVRPDAALAETIREDVILRSMWLDPAAFKVDVRDGVAWIEGRVDRRSVAEILKGAAALVPGIVRVDGDISWTVDDTEARPIDLEYTTVLRVS